MSYRNYATANSRIVDPSNNGDFTTISAALTASSSGQTIFVRPGTYTENLTMKSGVNISAFECDSQTPSVTIIGKCTSTSGNVTISGVRLQTNSDNIVACSGGEFNLINCDLNITNNSGLSCTSSGSIYVKYCKGNITTTGIALHVSTSSGPVVYFYSNIENSGGTTTASSASAGVVSLLYSSLKCPLTFTSTGTLSCNFSEVTCEGQNATAVTTAGTATHSISMSQLLSGSASALSIGSGTTVKISNSRISSSNTNAVTGAGSVEYQSLFMTNTSSTINTTTITGTYTSLAKWRGQKQPAFLAYQASSAANATGDGTLYTLGTTVDLTEIYDQDANFDPTSGTFTAPVDGRYLLMMNIFVNGGTDITEYECRIATSNRDYRFRSNFGTGADRTTYSTSCSALADMEAADTATFKIYTIDAGGKIDDVFGAAGEYWTIAQGMLSC